MLIEKTSRAKSPNENALVVGRHSLASPLHAKRARAVANSERLTTNDWCLTTSNHSRRRRLFERRGQIRRLRRQVSFELDQLRRDRRFLLVRVRQHVSGFEPVARDAEYGGFIREDSILMNQLARCAHRHAARGLGEDALALRQQLDGTDN